MDEKTIEKIYNASIQMQDMYKNSKSHKSIRHYTNPKDKGKEKIIGFTGEVLFAERYNLEACLGVYGSGDGHIDFKIQLNDDIILTIDVKTTPVLGHLFVKEWEIDLCSDILVMGKYIDNNTVDFVGWTTKKLIRKNGPKIFNKHLGIPNYYMHHSDLFKMEDLDKILKGPGVIIKQINHRES